MFGELLGLIGAILVLLSALGVVRFSDVLARLHALAKASTLGVLLLLAGAAVSLHDVNDITSVVLAALLHLLASPPASNMLSRATYLAGPAVDGVIDERRTASTDQPADPAPPARVDPRRSPP
jgi:multicomponent Na+:H+ antiporter subunit G